jgi:hypothetical protein
MTETGFQQKQRAVLSFSLFPSERGNLTVEGLGELVQREKQNQQ